MSAALTRRLLATAACVATAAAMCTASALPAAANPAANPAASPAATPAANPAGTGVVINEVYGGGGNTGAAYANDFIELYNPTDSPVSVVGSSVQYASASGTSWQVTELGTSSTNKSIAPGGYYLISEAAGSNTSLPPLPAPAVTGAIAMSGTSGTVALVSSSAALSCESACATADSVIDLVGYGSANDHEGAGAAPALTNSTSDSRIPAGHDTNDNAADFTRGGPTPQNSGGGGGTPPPPTCSGTLSIAEINGTDTDTSPCAGDAVTTSGVVTADYPTGGFNGFYLQTGGSGSTPEHPDATPGASDAVFVYGSTSAKAVSTGESVTVTGTVTEYQGMTEIEHPTVTRPAAALPAVVDDEIPWTELQTSAQKRAHAGEIMLPQGDFTVTDNYDTNYYGTITLAAGKTPLVQPTDAGTAGSQAAEDAVADNAKRLITLDDGSSWNYAVFGSHTSDPLPWLTPANPVRIGSAVRFTHEGVILEYRFGQWNFQPTHQITGDGADVATFSDTRAGNEQPASVGGDIRLATFNVENYFPTTGERYQQAGLGTCTYYTDRNGNKVTVDRCTGTDGSNGPRGAADATNFARQQDKIVTGINRLGAGIVSLEEIENSAKFGQPRDTALAGLVDALNRAAGSDVWAYVPSPPASQLPPLDQQDVIRTALIYQPAEVTPVGASHVLLGDSAPGQAFSIAREPLAQEFVKAGYPHRYGFLVVANHLKSKGSDASGLFDDCANGGDGENTNPADDQGGFNCTRVHEVKDMMAFASSVAASTGTNRILILGDLNSYTHEDPLQELYAGGYTDLGSEFDPSESTYSYGGLQGSLDHVLANPAALTMVTGADVWQINAQEAVAFAYSRDNYNITQLFNGSEPFAASDHDPVLVGLNLPQAPAWSASKVYTAGDQVTYQGSTWQALWWTQNQRPGNPWGAWEQIVVAPDGTAVWTPSRVFTSGDVVRYQGKTYTARWWTRNQAPGQPYGPWKLTG